MNVDFGWSYPPGCNGTPYDEEIPCQVCGKFESDCKCPERPECGECGNPDCYTDHKLTPAKDSVRSFMDHIGIEPIRDCLRAIDKYNVEHVWLEPLVPWMSKDRIYYHDHETLDKLPEWTRLKSVGVGGIAWDGSDWEFGETVPAGDWSALDAARQDFLDALDERTGDNDEI